MTDVSILNSSTDTAARELAALGSTLHEDSRSMTLQALDEIVNDKNIALAVVKDANRIVGMGTLYIIPKIGKKNAYLEDIIVDEAYRGQGLGGKLTTLLIESARARGVGSITLTSRDIRVAAHKLYTKLGFKIVETNVFKLKL